MDGVFAIKNPRICPIFPNLVEGDQVGHLYCDRFTLPDNYPQFLNRLKARYPNQDDKISSCPNLAENLTQRKPSARARFSFNLEKFSLIFQIDMKLIVIKGYSLPGDLIQ